MKTCRVPPVAVLILCAGSALASWRFDATPMARLDYGDLPVVTGGAAGAFSCFCTVKLDTLDEDHFIFGKLAALERGWSLDFDRTVGATGHERRFRFWVSNGAGAETERYTTQEAVAANWQALGGSYAWDENADGPALMRLYLDGVESMETPRFDHGRRPAVHADPLTVGASPGAGIESTNMRAGHVAVWDGCALTPDDHALLAAGADPRTVRPDCLTFYASLEDLTAEDLIGGAIPIESAGAGFSVDRWPLIRPLVTGLGDVGPSAIRVTSHVGRASEHRVEYTAGDFPGVVTAPVTAVSELDFVAAHELIGLEPATTYRYRVLVDDVVIPSTTSTFTTAPAGEEAVFSFLYASCTEYSTGVPPYDRYPFDVFGAIDERAPDFLVHSGDVWYSDHGGFNETDDFDAWTIGSIEAMNRKARETLGLKEFARSLGRFPVFSMPDDHEWTNNISNLPEWVGPRPERALGRILAWQFQRNPPRLPKAVEDDGLWYTFDYGGVDFFFLDVRTQRSSNAAPNDENKKMLGPDERQLADLLGWVETSTAPFKVILSPGMISPFGTTGSDAWGSPNGFSTDAERVVDLIAQHDDVVFFAGDVHWSGAIRLACHPGGNPAHDFYEFVGAPYTGHLSPPPPGGPEDLLFTYDGRAFDPPRTSYLQVTVDTTVTPATFTVRVISFDRADGTERIEYTHLTLTSRRTCAGDVDRDGAVEFSDLILLLAGWGQCPKQGRCPGDVDLDGDVDVADLIVLLAAWGPCTGQL